MSRFGEYLCEQGIITRDDLESALRSMAVYGGRIGTNLLELGTLSMEELAAYLSEFLQIPLPPPDWVESPEDKALKLVPMQLLRRCSMLPLKVEQSRIHVVMLEPRNLDHLDFVAAASSRQAVPYTLPEAQLAYWLEVHLDVQRHPRLINLASRTRQVGISADFAESATPLSFARQRSLESLEPTNQRTLSAEQLGAAPEAATPAPNPEPLPPLDPRHAKKKTGPEGAGPQAPKAPLPPLASADSSGEIASQPPHTAPASPPSVAPAEEPEEILLDELLLDEPADESPEQWVDPELTPEAHERNDDAPVPARLANLEAQLDAASERNEIIRLALQISRTFARASALFLVRGDCISGFRADGPGMDAGMAGIEIPMQTTSILTYPAQTGAPFRGNPPTDGIDGRLFAQLGREDVQEAFITPIVIGDRVVNLLYCDNGPDAFAETAIAGITALCDCLSRAYERLILENKKKK